MSLLDQDEVISTSLAVSASRVAVRMAIEGIPVAAIARSLSVPSAHALASLQIAQVAGDITAVPRYDWNPKTKIGDRMPQHSTVIPEGDLLFMVRKSFKLAPLEAAFLVVLMRCEHADKARLHTVIENQRFSRSSNPDRLEVTEQKMVDVIICKLRKRLKGVSPDFKIETVWGSGYYIEHDVRDAIMSRLKAEMPSASEASPA